MHLHTKDYTCSKSPLGIPKSLEIALTVPILKSRLPQLGIVVLA